MKTYQTEKLLDKLAADVRQILLQTEQLRNFSDEQLQQRPAPESWSAVEVIAHLNYYARYYTNAIETQLDGHQTQSRARFRPGWFGNYFTKVIGPAPDGQVRNKMKTFKDAVPPPPAALDTQAELQEFTGHQHQLLNLLQIARSANLERLRVSITLTRLIRLKLGDTFRFLIAHEQRHFQQIERTLAVVTPETAEQI